jgi:hypothetical protein
MRIALRHILLFLLASVGLAASVPSATAQPTPSELPKGQANQVFALPVESVTVLAIRPSGETIKGFVEARVVPTYTLRRMARWTMPVCPATVGLGDKYANYVSQRIREVAAAVGAPVNGDPNCRSNIEVVFTTTPQDLMNNIRKTDPIYLGFHFTNREADELAKVTHPIQAWYTTLSTSVGERRPLGRGGASIDAGCPTTPSTTPGGAPTAGMVVIKLGGVHELYLPCLHTEGASGSRAKDDLVSGFFNILIVAEPAKLNDYEVGSLADYITMLALSQPSLDRCPELPSISNMLAKVCASATTSRITDGDLAYLRALYRMPGGELIAAQQDFIRDEMYKTLVTDKGR